jgi:hypothetical protein
MKTETFLVAIVALLFLGVYAENHPEFLEKETRAVGSFVLSLMDKIP